MVSISRWLRHGGRLASCTDPLGARTTFAYDSHGFLTSLTDAYQNTQPTPRSRSYSYTYMARDATKLQTLAITDPRGLQTQLTYDSMGNVTQDSYRGDPWQPWTQNLYAYVGNNPVNYVDPTGHEAAWVNQLTCGAATCGDHDGISSASGSSSDLVGPAVAPNGCGGAATALDQTTDADGSHSRNPDLIGWSGVCVVEAPASLKINPPVSGSLGPHIGPISILLAVPGAGGGGGSGGWKPGDDVNAPTRSGKAPAWSTIRARFWKNAASALDALAKWGAENVERMRNGLAPQRYNANKGGWESMDLSHEPHPRRLGGTEFVPRWPQDHANVDPFRRPGY